MDTDTLACQDLLRQCTQVASFTLALHRVACMYAWRDLEPYAEEAWYQISAARGPMWVEIREFVREAWID
ncbi:hypothetical protein LK996_09810 [Lysobacter sp. A6]|uniref:Uncharacterized protein n=1 Tax=Noviluteimonas lactosilytica TaxID=2888523 RepID=A0ABS8JIE6_9GAMM|nr:hypothetical protein [Lysobacter lactosilyticus]MCC8363366.1 hypothetical protein [Lysobacter lactosilyticus]